MISFEHLTFKDQCTKAFLLLNLIFVTKEEGTMTQSFNNNNKLYVSGKIGAADLCGGLICTTIKAYTASHEY